ncbi:hypothetical protein TorRG33x02_243540 [Trema orientale]|uniref:Uncharacterized protein n=1 Tax=Trema orientale TaxID=63057 RepID=A0A2P5DSA2_TREOI|nr:hypothetical protein TorRG33x02_243540 [Trema orientale]
MGHQTSKIMCLVLRKLQVDADPSRSLRGWLTSVMLKIVDIELSVTQTKTQVTQRDILALGWGAEGGEWEKESHGKMVERQIQNLTNQLSVTWQNGLCQTVRPVAQHCGPRAWARPTLGGV